VGVDSATSVPSTTIEPRSREYSSLSTRVLPESSRSSSERTTWM
jgi:hypothetical protein